MPILLPFEIWTQIHTLACTDDGFAGRALSLVSKDWRAISAPFKFQSIALIGAKPILRFVCLLESTPENLRNVESLFIGCQNLRLYPSSSCRLDLAHERALGLTVIEKAVVRILRKTAATLHTLHTHFSFLERPGPLYPVFLPNLRALVMHGPFASPVNSTLSPMTPRLRWLRFAPPPTSSHKGSVLLNTISAAAPSLSHLCVT
ncbi:hypothetical protein B0H11DRAFT_1808585, partial [Mycena galericulata]